MCVGDELLRGTTVDAHGAFIGAFLTERGFTVTEIRLVPDSLAAIRDTVLESVRRSSLLVVTGGLGPTTDDVTREALAAASDSPLVFDEDAWKEIQELFGRVLTGSNRRQAERPESFQALPNARGTAPGLIGVIGECRVAALPGPPGELRGMIAVHGDRIVAGLGTEPGPESVCTCFGVPESGLEDALLRLVSARRAAGEGAPPALRWHTRAEPGRIVLRLAGGPEKEREAVVAELRKQFGCERVARGEESLAALVVRGLSRRGLLLAAAESCTGGLIGGAVTDVPGSSAVFWGSIVSYANAAKEKVLGVRPETLADHGAVSRECVIEMAQGVRRIAGADLAVAVSGIAGPDGGTADKPVGTVWIALSGPSGPVARSFAFPPGRDRVRRLAVTEALLLVSDEAKLA
jgi:nicotinamide-nucleotide amidase